MFKEWIDEEIQFLKFAYPGKEFTVEEISQALSRDLEDIHLKARELGLKLYEEDLPINHKRCIKCNTIIPIQFFKKGDSWCQECRRDTGENSEEKYFKKCPKCNEEKSILDFYRNKARSDGREQYCIECVKALKRQNRLKKKEVNKNGK